MCKRLCVHVYTYMHLMYTYCIFVSVYPCSTLNLLSGVRTVAAVAAIAATLFGFPTVLNNFLKCRHLYSITYNALC